MNLAPDTPLRGLPCAVIDVETTGLEPDAHIIEVAVAHVELGGGLPRVAFTSRVRPPIPIPRHIVALTGVTEEAAAAAPTWAELAPRVLAACAGRVVAAYNAPADYGWIRGEVTRAGGVALPWPWLDLLVLRKACVEKGPPGRLAHVVAMHGIELEAHGATGDAVATALVLDRLMRRAYEASQGFTDERGARARWDRYEGEDDEETPPEPVRTLAAFLRWQRRAALYQERDFAAYRQRQGDRTPPSCPWHEIEGVITPTWTLPPPTRMCSCNVFVTLRVARDGAIRTVTTAGEPHVCTGRPA